MALRLLQSEARWKVIAALKAAHPTYRIETDTKDDSEWNEYQKYISINMGPLTEGPHALN